MLSQDVQAYLAVRQAMGFSLKWSGNLLRAFAAFSDAAGQHHVCAETAIMWAGSSPSVRTRARRLGLVIRLARYLRAEDQRHEVPPPVFGSEDRKRRPTPYIYSREDIQRLVQAASEVGRYPRPEYRGLTYSTFFGLLASTGMRLSEAINLRLQDITPDGVVVRQTKFRKSRLLPLHPTAQAVVERYLPRRRAFAPFDDHVFVGLRKHKLLRHDVYVAFRKSIEKIGLRRSDRPRPTIHALRHTFAVRALETCPDDRDRITRHMVALSTYLGHGDIAYTYWYLEATPELMRNIAESSQRYFRGGRS